MSKQAIEARCPPLQEMLTRAAGFDEEALGSDLMGAEEVVAAHGGWSDAEENAGMGWCDPSASTSAPGVGNGWVSAPVTAGERAPVPAQEGQREEEGSEEMNLEE